MDTKKCFKCEIEWPLIYFYKHSEMKDGHLNKCKKCTRTDSLNHRAANIDKVRLYDRERSKTGKRKERLAKNSKQWRKNNPEKYIAQNAVNNAVRDKRLVKGVCCVCGDKNVHGHHEDYDRPLDVIWLCPKHHWEADLR